MAEFPQDYVFWDSWYLYSESDQTFHCLMLCAKKRYYSQDKHHEHSQLAYSHSNNLVEWSEYRQVQLPLEDNSSIWTGSLIKWKG